MKSMKKNEEECEPWVLKNEGLDWLKRARIFDMHLIYFDLEHLNIETTIAQAAGCHGNVLRFSAYVGFWGQAAYRSNLVPMPVEMGDRDWLQEAVTACRKYGLKILAMVCSFVDGRPYSDHPETVVRTPEGEAVRWGSVYSMCINGPHRGFILNVIKEIAQNYDVDGIYLDQASNRVCYCSFCTEKFKAEHGAAIPKKENWSEPLWKLFVQWRVNSVENYVKDVVKTVKGVNPNLAVVVNTAGWYQHESHYLGSVPEEFARYCDGILVEGWLRGMAESFHHPGRSGKFGSAIGKPSLIHVEYPNGYWNFTPCPEAELRIKAAEVVAHGGLPLVVNGPFSYPSLNGVKDIFGIVEENEDCYKNAVPINFCALLYSRGTGFLYGKDNSFERHTKFFKGFYDLLTNAHIPFNLIFDKDIDARNLAQYDMLCLPNAACLDDKQAMAVKEYVEAGGGLVATYESSLYDEKGDRREDFVLRDLINAHYLDTCGDPEMFLYAQVTKAHPVTAGLDIGQCIPIGGKHLVVEPLDKDKVVMTLAKAAHQHSGLERTPLPSVLVNSFGKGKVVYIAGDVESVYYERPYPGALKLFKNAVNWAALKPSPIITDAPPSVEFSLMQQPSRMILHLINLTTDTRGLIDFVAPLYNLNVKVSVGSRQVKKVFTLREKKEMQYEVTAGYVAFRILTLKEYEVVVIDSI